MKTYTKISIAIFTLITLGAMFAVTNPALAVGSILASNNVSGSAYDVSPYASFSALFTAGGRSQVYDNDTTNASETITYTVQAGDRLRVACSYPAVSSTAQVVGYITWNCRTASIDNLQGTEYLLEFDSSEVITVVFTYGGSGFYFGTMQVYRLSGTATPSPTPTTTGTPYFVATAIPQATQAYCIPAQNVQVTATPQQTPTPAFGTPSPTITPTATTTASLGADYPPLDVLSEFNESMRPWAPGTWDLLYSVQYTTALGADNRRGAVIMPVVSATTNITSLVYNTQTTASVNQLLAFQAAAAPPLTAPDGVLPMPLKLSGYMRADDIAVGNRVFLKFWYHTINNDWVYGGGYTEVPNGTWQRFTYIFSNTLTTIDAVAVQAVQLGTAQAPRLVRVDSLHVLGNPDIINITDIYSQGNPYRLPACGNTSISLTDGRPVVPLRACVIERNVINVFARCDQYNSITQFGAFLSCRVETYFGFLEENREQTEALGVRLYGVEPVGSIAEVGDLVDIIANTASDIYNQYPDGAAIEYRTIDLATLWNWEAIDTPPVLDPGSSNNDFETVCPQFIVGISEQIQRAACWTVYQMRYKFFNVTAIMQWMIDFASLASLFIYVKRTWQA